MASTDNDFLCFIFIQSNWFINSHRKIATNTTLLSVYIKFCLKLKFESIYSILKRSQEILAKY